MLHVSIVTSCSINVMNSWMNKCNSLINNSLIWHEPFCLKNTSLFILLVNISNLPPLKSFISWERRHFEPVLSLSAPSFSHRCLLHHVLNYDCCKNIFAQSSVAHHVLTTRWCCGFRQLNALRSKSQEMTEETYKTWAWLINWIMTYSVGFSVAIPDVMIII